MPLPIPGSLVPELEDIEAPPVFFCSDRPLEFSIQIAFFFKDSSELIGLLKPSGSGLEYEPVRAASS